MLFTLPFQEIIVVLAALVLGFVLHEYAHAKTAYILGDHSDENKSRLTLNPLTHIDPMGFIMIVLVGFGWAKPVRINVKAFKNPIRDEIIVSLAGPLMNFFLALLFAILMRLSFYIIDMNTASEATVLTVVMFFRYFIIYNLVLGVFNLIPLPPLDGSHIYTTFLARYKYDWYVKISRAGMMILFALIIGGRLLGRNLLPITQIVYGIYNRLIVFLFT